MKILLVDDDSEFVSLIKSTMVNAKIDYVSTVDSAIKKIEGHHYDLIIMDWMLPLGSGKKLLDWCHNNKKKLEDTKVWVNSPIPTDRIKKYTNGSRLFNKLNNKIIEAIRDESFESRSSVV